MVWLKGWDMLTVQSQNAPSTRLAVENIHKQKRVQQNKKEKMKIKVFV